MPDLVIKVEGLGKRYRIGQYVGGKYQYRTLRDVLANGIRVPFRLLQTKKRQQAVADSLKSASFEVTSNNQHLSPTSIWALKDVSFEIKQGEVVGFIGRNGAGKTTLLKVLSRITEPTEGRAEVKGRVGSLLEVGIGFHAELTGRENIYLSSALLGMGKKEIQRKFDEIVDFSGIEKFIDTPAKRYSSGMWVRLGFAVAAHLELDILMVDEVLAVGDFAFQKKCLGKMRNVAGQGRTVLFVSHQMEAIANLCPRSILLQDGSIVEDGPSQKVIEHYLQSAQQLAETSLRDRKDRTGHGRLRFVDAWIENKDRKRTHVVQSGDSITIVGEYQVLNNETVSNVVTAFALYGKNHVLLTDLSNLTTGDFFHGPMPKNGQIRCVIPRLPLNSGIYTYNVIARSGLAVEDFVLEAGCFEVESGDYFGSGKTVGKNLGMFLIDHRWEVVPTI